MSLDQTAIFQPATGPLRHKQWHLGPRAANVVVVQADVDSWDHDWLRREVWITAYVVLVHCFLDITAPGGGERERTFYSRNHLISWYL